MPTRLLLHVATFPMLLLTVNRLMTVVSPGLTLATRNFSPSAAL